MTPPFVSLFFLDFFLVYYILFLRGDFMLYFRQLCFSCADGSLVNISHTFVNEVDADSWLDKFLDLFSEFSPSFDCSCLDDDRSFLDGDPCELL